jgi:hypothetical protein
MKTKNSETAEANHLTIMNLNWLFVVIAFFSLVFFRSLEFLYVEGDDAYSIAYHVMGRNEGIQGYYSSYQKMMDVVLSILTPDESFLRHSALIITAIFTIITFSLILFLVKDWTKNEKLPPFWVTTLAVMLAVPEIFYFGLVYSPTLVGFSFIISSHLLIHSVAKENSGLDFHNKRHLMWFLVSVALFGLGVSFRWNLGSYVVVIFVELLNIRPGNCFEKRRIIIACSWGIAGFLASVLMIRLSGVKFSSLTYQLTTASDVAALAGNLSNTNVSQWISSILSMSPMITPGFGLITVIGLYHIIRNRNMLWVTIISGLVIALPWVKSGNPKFLIVALPALIAGFCIGFSFVWRENESTVRTYLSRFLTVIVLIVPWVIGVQAVLPGNAWGPFL